MKELPHIRKAVTFRASAIGDCLMGKYLLENVRALYPEARVGIVVASRGAMIRDLFAAYPWLEVIEANRRNPRALATLWHRFHGSDLVVTQYAGKHGGSFGFGSKIAARALAHKGGLVGFSDASTWNERIYDHLLPVDSHSAVAEHERAALRVFGLSVPLPFPTLRFIRQEGILRSLHLAPRQFVIVHLFAGNTKRSMSPKTGRALLVALRETLPSGVSILVSGSESDRAAALEIASGTGADVLAGRVSLQELITLLAESRSVVSVDTGVAHMAAQVGVPLLVMRTCLGPNWWYSGQYGPEARVTVFEHDAACVHGHQSKAYPACIEGIDVAAVAARAAAII